MVSVRPEEPAASVTTEEKADEFSLDEVAGDVDGSSSGVECGIGRPKNTFFFWNWLKVGQKLCMSIRNIVV